MSPRAWRFGGVLVLSLVVGFALYACATIAVPACRAANGFLAGVRDGDIARARAFVMPDLVPSLEVLDERAAAAPALQSTERGRAILRLRRWPPGEMTTGQLTAGFHDGCFSTDLKDDQPLWIVVRKEGGSWRVADLGTQGRPSVCESDPP